MATTDVVLIPQDIPLNPFGFEDVDLDTHNNETGYSVVDLTDGRLVGVVGIVIPAEDGLDAVFGWIGPNSKSTNPFRSVQDATADLLANADI